MTNRLEGFSIGGVFETLGALTGHILGLRKARTKWLEEVVEETDAANQVKRSRYDATLRVARLQDAPVNPADDKEYDELKAFLSGLTSQRD